MTKISNFATRVRELRAERGLSKSALARAVGVTPTCVWNWEEGNTRPRADALARVAKTLATSEEFLERGVQCDRLPFVSTSSASPAEVPTGASDRLAEVIRRARAEIAAAAGLGVDQVKVVLEYGI
jgi:transcriptional regulator with XRE-family HTH domain